MRRRFPLRIVPPGVGPLLGLVAALLFCGCQSSPKPNTVAQTPPVPASPQPAQMVTAPVTALPAIPPPQHVVVPASLESRISRPTVEAVPVPSNAVPIPSHAAPGPEPLPAPPGVPALAPMALSLEDAVGLGLSDNPRLHQLAALTRVARANADVAFAPFLPEIGTSMRYSAFSSPVLPGGAFVPASLPAGVDSFAVAEIGVQHTIADFGRRAGHYGQAVHRSRSQDLALTRARQTIAFEVVQAYFHVLAAQANLRVREEAQRDAERILFDTKARREGGVVDRDAVLRAEVELALTRQNLLSARQGVRDARSRLNVVMGQPPVAPLSVNDVLARPRFQLPLEACLEQAVADRREIGMAREAVAVANHGVEAARGELLPKVYVRGTALRADSPGDLNGFVEGIGLHVEQPLYAGGRYKGGVRSSEAQVSAALADLRVILDNVALQVTVAYEAIETDRQRIELAETAIVQARENLRLIIVRYQNGNATPTDVVDAQTALIQMQTNYFTAVYGYLEGLARLDYALGGDQQTLMAQLRPAWSGVGDL
ncbi:MAG: TolC family protein [Pirellulales bacterium]|nr:TolC family protein [Pirellulales bacterium]